jgi:hypothetical protein
MGIFDPSLANLDPDAIQAAQASQGLPPTNGIFAQAPPPQAPQPMPPTGGVASMMMTPDDALAAAGKKHPWITGLRLLGATMQDMGQGLAGHEGDAVTNARADIYNQAMIPARAGLMQSVLGGGTQGGGQPTVGNTQPAAAGQGNAAQPPATDPASMLSAVAQKTKRLQAAVAVGLLTPQQFEAMKPKITVSPTGIAYDENSGQTFGRLGVNLANVNGTQVDPNDAGNVNRFVPQPPVQGAVPLYGEQGSAGAPVAWRMPDGAVQDIQAVAQAQAQGSEQGKANVQDPRTLVTIPDPNNPGATKVITQGQLAAMSGNGGAPNLNPPPATPTGAGGAPTSVGGTASAADTAFATGQATDLSSHISALTDAREPAIQSRQNALQAQAFALSHPMNPATPGFVAGANYLRTLPPSVLQAAGVDPSKVNDLATDAATFNRVTNQNILSLGKTLLPSRYTERELNLTKPIAGGLTTPNEAMEFSAAIQGAGAARQKAQADFAANYTGPKSRQSFEQAWAASPAGQRSIFQDPEMWSHVQIHGKPAVVYTPDGKWGAFALGSPQAYKFRVQ